MPDARGLPEEVQNLLILTFAWQTGRSFFLHGGPYEATVESISDEVELREQALPKHSEWEQAPAAGLGGLRLHRLSASECVERQPPLRRG